MRDGVPRCPVEGNVTGTLIEGDALVLELTVGENLEANRDHARQEDRRIDFGGNQGLPLGIGNLVDLVEIVFKINAPGVGKDFDTSARTRMPGESRAGEAALATGAGIAGGVGGSVAAEAGA